MKSLFERHSAELRAALENSAAWHAQLAEAAALLRQAFDAGRVAYAIGNGGSATLAQHLSDEMLGRYRSNRGPLPVAALTADSAALTCIANDFGYEHVFSRQITALGRAGDVLIAFSTSGNSPNVLAACEAARQQKMTIIGLTGSQGQLRTLCDVAVISPGQNTARIQELDLHGIHLICELFEPRDESGKV